MYKRWKRLARRGAIGADGRPLPLGELIKAGKAPCFVFISRQAETMDEITVSREFWHRLQDELYKLGHRYHVRQLSTHGIMGKKIKVIR